MPLSRVPPRWRPLALLVPAVLALHALVLGLLPLGVGGDWPADAKRQPLQVRQLPAAAPAVAFPVAPAPAVPVPRGPALRTPAPVEGAAGLPPAPAQAPPTPEPATAAASAADAAPLEAPPPAPAATLMADAAPAPAAPAADPAGGAPPPVFATRFPPAASLQYDLRRGVLSGQGQIHWRPADGRYELLLSATVLGVQALDWSSTGALDAAGLAPERFLDRRRGGRSNAANFQRAAGRITFSGPAVEYPLLPGAQDRLSWAVQLAAIVAADPARFGPGAEVPMFVTGARGDAGLWTFAVQAREDLELPAGPVPQALRLRRQRDKPHDTTVEVWLDPARHWLPVRMRWVAGPQDDTTDFRLSAFAQP